MCDRRYHYFIFKNQYINILNAKNFTHIHDKTLILKRIEKKLKKQILSCLEIIKE